MHKLRISLWTIDSGEPYLVYLCIVGKYNLLSLFGVSSILMRPIRDRLLQFGSYDIIHNQQVYDAVVLPTHNLYMAIY